MKKHNKDRPTIRHILLPAFMDLWSLVDEFLMFKNNWPNEFWILSINELSATAWVPMSWFIFLKVDNLLASSSSLWLF